MENYSRSPNTAWRWHSKGCRRRIPDEGTLDDYLKSIGESTARRHTEIYLINCDDVTQAEEKLLRNHDSDEKKRVDRVIYYKEMGVAHQQVGDKHYYMIILMR